MVFNWPLTTVIYPSSVSQSVQSLSHSQNFVTHGLQHIRPLWPSQIPELSHIYVHWVGDVMQPSHSSVIPFLLLPSIFPSIRVFSDESAVYIRWPKYYSFSFSISTSNEYSGWFPSGWTGWISLQSKGLSRVFSNTTVQKYQFFCAQFYL